MENLYLWRDGERLGPYSLSVLRATWEHGGSADGDLVWDVEAGQWIPAPEFFSARTEPVSSAQPPPPPPPTSKPPIPDPSPIPPPFPLDVQPAQSVRQHGIFYYAFWGTVSVLVTLVILFIGFIFLTTTGAGFMSGYRSAAPSAARSPTNSAVRNLPALTQDEARNAISLLNNLHVRTDDIEGTTWYSPDDGFSSAVYLYIGKKKFGQPWLRWKIRYYGSDWLFIRGYRVKIDEDDPITLLPAARIKRESGSGSLWETLDEPASDHSVLLNKILASKITQVRMQGVDGSTDFVLTPEALGRMRSVLLVFRYLGGTWPAD